MRPRKWIFPLALLCAFSLHLFGFVFVTLTKQQNDSVKAFASDYQTRVQNASGTPFMHRPYYGDSTVISRSYSYFDHDQPWYSNDGIFVRYDGVKWTGASIMSCTGYVNCYDGHNGYDLNMSFEPVLSVAAGTVTRAGWYNPLNHNDGFGLWVAVDHGNGYLSTYGHLSAITVANGDSVGAQWQLGVSGTTGASTGPHLHLSVFDLPGWQATDPFGWDGGYSDPNSVADNYLWVSDPASSTQVPNLNQNNSAVYPGATLVDDGGAGWSSTGSWSSATESTDINGNLHYTSTSSTAVTATATWQPTLPTDGYYEVGVFVDDTHASSSWVPYTVYSADPNNISAQLTHVIYVDESHIGTFQGPYGWENTGPKWVALGTYYFRASMNGRVVVNNATGESNEQLSADGVEFVPTPDYAALPYDEAFASTALPHVITPGSLLPMNITVQNSGLDTWSAGGSNQVTLGYRWLDSSGKPLDSSLVNTNSVGQLPDDIAPNGSVTIPIRTFTPIKPGTYQLVYDMEQSNGAGGETWFSSRGALPLTLPVTIVPPVHRTPFHP